jgi:pyrroloquinoline quinone biosynthesis protein E
VQISIQGADADSCLLAAGRPVFEQKLEAAGWVKELELPLTLNVVLHRANIASIEEIITLAERLEVDRLELANTQYLAWALLNREQLLPTKEQLDSARRAARAAQQRLKGRMDILFVLPDYYSDRPKACMSGWGRRYLVVSPDGQVLPCHLAHTIKGMRFENVREQSLEQIWRYSAGFQAFRGEAWMQEPCATCERRTLDFGGCRCQAFHLAGQASIADPACSLSPAHGLVKSARLASSEPVRAERLIYRRRALSGFHP